MCGPIPVPSLHMNSVKSREKNQFWFNERVDVFIMPEQKIKQDIHIGANIRAARNACGVGQTELVAKLQLLGVEITRETLVKIERGIQHVQASQLRGIRDALGTTYDALLKES